MYPIMSSVNNDSFTSTFPVWMPFISFSCLITEANTSNTMLNRSGKSGHPCLLPNLRGKAFSFCLVNMILVVGFSHTAFIMLRYSLYFPLAECFYHKWVLYFIKCFLCIYWCDHVSVVFHIVYVVYYIYWFAYIVPSLHPWDESHLIMVYDLIFSFFIVD